jgi:hypothetical protein
MVRGDFKGVDNLSKYFKGLAVGLGDLRPLGVRCGELMLQGNRDGLGTDLLGNKLVPLSPNTLKRGRPGDGDPLSPRGLGSRIVTNAKISIANKSGSVTAVEIEFVGMPWLRFHETGTKYMPIRDIVGIRPNTMKKITDVVHEYMGNLVDARPGLK